MESECVTSVNKNNGLHRHNWRFSNEELSNNKSVEGLFELRFLQKFEMIRKAQFGITVRKYNKNNGLNIQNPFFSDRTIEQIN